MKKRNKIISIVLLSLLAVGLASAGLLQYFGRITTTADVEQAITLVGATEHTIPEDAPGGEEFCYLHKLDNKASVDIDVGFKTTPEYEGVTTTIYKVPETRTLILENKDGNWNVIPYGMQATLTFDPVSTTFDYTLIATGLQINTEYALIYYGDDDPRFNKWGGNNPGKVIEIFMTDASGDYNSGSKSKDLGMNLPSSPDWNINPIPDYCALHNGWDNYVHCKGAKIWIVPTSDLTGSNSLPLIAWNPSSYLFETDLITYFDCNETIEDFAVDMEEGDAVTTLETKTKTLTPMLVCYGFDVAIAPGTYVITTDIIPPTD